MLDNEVLLLARDACLDAPPLSEATLDRIAALLAEGAR